MANCHGSVPERWSGACTSQAWSGDHPLVCPYCWMKLAASPLTVPLFDSLESWLP